MKKILNDRKSMSCLLMILITHGVVANVQDCEVVVNEFKR